MWKEDAGDRQLSRHPQHVLSAQADPGPRTPAQRTEKKRLSQNCTKTRTHGEEEISPAPTVCAKPPILPFVRNFSTSSHISKMGAKPDHGGASRQEKKAKKRKLEAAIPDVPGDDEVDVPEVDAPEKSSKKRKKEHKKSEENAEPVKEDAQDDAKAEEGAVMADAAAATADAPRKSKKERKAERKAKEAAEAAAAAEAEKLKSKSEDVDQSEKQKKKGGNKTESSEQKDGQEKSAKKKSKKEKKPKPEAGAEEADDEKADGLGSKGEAKAARFIVFIGWSLPKQNSVWIGSKGLC